MSFQPPRPIFVLVDRRDRRTLENVIQRYVLPGTRIVSDEWAAYNQLNRLGYNHMTVNHSVNYVNPINGEAISLYFNTCSRSSWPGRGTSNCYSLFIYIGATTNNIEAAWKWAKQFCASSKIQTDEQLYKQLTSYMWRKWRGEVHAGGSFHELLENIAELYPLWLTVIHSARSNLFLPSLDVLWCTTVQKFSLPYTMYVCTQYFI